MYIKHNTLLEKYIFHFKNETSLFASVSTSQTKSFVPHQAIKTRFPTKNPEDKRSRFK